LTRLLRAFVRRGFLTIGMIIGASAACLLLVPNLGSELFPNVDAGTFEVRLKTIPGSKLERTEEVVKRLEQSIKDTIGEEHIETIIANIGLPVGKGAGFSTILSSNAGPDTAYLIVNLKNDRKRRGTLDYVEELRSKWKDAFPDEKFLFVTGGIVNAALNEGSPAPIDIELKISNLEVGRQAAEKIIAGIQDVEGAVDIQLAQAQDLPQLDIHVDRLKASRYGLSQDDVAKTILSAYGASTGYTQNIWVDPASGKDFFMGVQLRDNRAESLEELRNLPLRIQTSKGPEIIPLSHIAEIRRVAIPGEIAHADISRVNNVYVNVENRDLGSVVADIEERLARIELPPGVTVSLQGPVLTMREGASDLGLGLTIATAMVFLILIAQFKSFLDPLIILLAVPLALAGAVLALYLSGSTLNIQSLMGGLMLIGVVVNNSILLVGFANAELAAGKSPLEAAVSAARVRARPILMTSLTLVASMAPFAFELLPGNEVMVPLARAVIGGMVFSTILTLFLVPAVFSLLKRRPSLLPAA
jgi:multidrug efflux pump subunit AcrB